MPATAPEKHYPQDRDEGTPETLAPETLPDAHSDTAHSDIRSEERPETGSGTQAELLSQPAPSEQDTRLAALLFQLAGHGQRLSATVLDEFNIAPNELAVLDALNRQNAPHTDIDTQPTPQSIARPSPLMVKEIHAQLSDLSPSTLTRTLDNLERKQWIIRSLNRADRRSFQVALSAAGRATLDAYRATLTRRFTAAARSLSSGERMLLTELLERILGR